MGAVNVNTLKEIDQIVEVVKSMGQVSFNDISTLTGISTRKIGYLYHNYIKDYPEIGYSLVKRGSGTSGGQTATLRYSNYNKAKVPVNDPAPEKPEEKPVTKNGEGYPDPTMARALARVDSRVKPGEIWRDDSTCGAKYLILSCHKNILNCLMVKELDNYYDERCDIKFESKNEEYYIAPYRILSKPARFMVLKHSTTAPEWFNYVRGTVVSYLGFDAGQTMSEPITKIVEVPVEKIVEKKIEVPVEKIVYRDKPTDVSALTEYKAVMFDKYQEVFLSMLSNMKMNVDGYSPSILPVPYIIPTDQTIVTC